MRVLHILSELDGGGVDRLLYDYCSRIISDIEFDFVVVSKKEGILEQPLKDLGCKVFHVAQMREDLNRHNAELMSIMRNGNYDIVHIHSGYKAYFDLRCAKKCEVKCRLVHSHLAFEPEKFRQRLERMIFTPLTKMLATQLCACGRDAAVWMWGAKAYASGKVFVMRNAIDVKRFQFNSAKRDELRKQLGLEGKFVIGNVARFSYQKNHEFLLKIFKEVLKKRHDAVLLLVGRGELFEEVQQQAKDLGIFDSIVFLGVRNDVPELLNAMDVFVLPSRYEGLPVVLVEVQGNGLPVFASDKITDEIKLNDNVDYLSLDNVDEWADKICLCDTERVNVDMSEYGYDIDVEAKNLKEFYVRLCGDKD